MFFSYTDTSELPSVEKNLWKQINLKNNVGKESHLFTQDKHKIADKPATGEGILSLEINSLKYLWVNTWRNSTAVPLILLIFPQYFGQNQAVLHYPFSIPHNLLISSF